MQPDVIDVVSNGVLRHQAKQIEQVEKICKILQEDGSIFTVEEVIEKKLTKDSLIRRKAKRHVSWNGTGGVSCSCNGLVYRGMPCMHISLIAIAKNFKIPLACFNKRYCYEIPDVRQPENSLPKSSSQQQPPHSPDEASSESVFIPGPEQHITEAFLNSHFSDDDSIRIRGELRSLELYILKEFKPRSNLEEVLDWVQSLRTNLKTKVDELSCGREETQVIVPHATRPVRNNSYITVPNKVAQACAEAMMRDNQDTNSQRRERSISSSEINSHRNKRRRTSLHEMEEQGHVGEELNTK